MQLAMHGYRVLVGFCLLVEGIFYGLCLMGLLFKREPVLLVRVGLCYCKGC